MTNIMTILPKYISLLKLSRDSGFSTKIGTIPPNSGRLDTLQGFFLGGRGSEDMLPRKKKRNLRSSNCWKCIEIANLTITLLFLYDFKSFTIPSGGPFWLLAHGAPPAYGPINTAQATKFGIGELCETLCKMFSCDNNIKPAVYFILLLYTIHCVMSSII